MGGHQFAVEMVLHSEIVCVLFQAEVFFPQVHETEVFQPHPFHRLGGLSHEPLHRAVISMTTCSTGVHDRLLPALKEMRTRATKTKMTHTQYVLIRFKGFKDAFEPHSKLGYFTATSLRSAMSSKAFPEPSTTAARGPA